MISTRAALSGITLIRQCTKIDESGEKHLVYGGDFDDRSTDYIFCTDGIVYADRTPSPKMQEVKQLYAPVRLTVDETGVTVENRNLFLPLSEYCFRVVLTKEDRFLGKKPLRWREHQAIPYFDRIRYCLRRTPGNMLSRFRR